LKYYQQQGDKGRVIGYSKAITFLKQYGKPIESAEDVNGLPHIGDKIKKKIKEILETGKLSKFQFLQEGDKQ